MNRRELIKRTAILLGGALSSSLTAAVLAGAAPSRIPSRQVFDANGKAMLKVAVELIIPRTDTPGAIDAGVHNFIEMMAADWYTDTEREIFLVGLLALDKYCYQSYDRSFVDCSNDEQISAMEFMEKESQAYQGEAAQFMSREEDENKPFFTKLKELTVLGYYTSEKGATEELSYNPVPMQYDGDFDYSDIGKQWSY